MGSYRRAGRRAPRRRHAGPRPAAAPRARSAHRLGMAGRAVGSGGRRRADLAAPRTGAALDRRGAGGRGLRVPLHAGRPLQVGRGARAVGVPDPVAHRAGGSAVARGARRSPSSPGRWGTGRRAPSALPSSASWVWLRATTGGAPRERRPRRRRRLPEPRRSRRNGPPRQAVCVFLLEVATLRASIDMPMSLPPESVPPVMPGRPIEGAFTHARTPLSPADCSWEVRWPPVRLPPVSALRTPLRPPVLSRPRR